MRRRKLKVSNKDEIVQIAKQSVRGGYYLFVGNTSSTAILAVSSMIIARLLGPADYGLFSLSIVIPSLFIGLIDFGIGSAVIRFSAKLRAEGREEKAQSFVKISLFFELTVGIATFVLCFAFADSLATYLINRSEASPYVKLSSLLILFQTLFNMLNSAFIGFDIMEKSAIMMIIRALTKLVLSPLLIVLGFGVLGALTGHFSCYIIAVAVGSVILISKLHRCKNDYPNNILDNLKSMLKYGIPLYASNILGLFAYQYQSITMAFFSSNTEIGNFQVATLFSSAMTILIYPTTALFPAFSKLKKEGRNLSQFFKRSVKYTAILLIPATMVIVVMSKDLVFTFFGSDYGLAPSFVSLYILPNLYAGFGSVVLVFLFNGIGRTDIVLKSNIVNLLVFIPLAPLLTAKYNITGLIVAFLISNSCSLAYSLLTAIKKVKVHLDIISSAKIYFASTVSVLPLMLFIIFSPFSKIPNIIFGVLIFCLIYLTLLPVTGILNATDLKIFEQMFCKIKSGWPILKLLILYETKLSRHT